MVVGDIVSGFFEDPVLVGIVVVMLGLVFFLYLFLRRTVSEFKEGMRGGR